MESYLVSSYYRGAMNVDQMRSFTEEKDAWLYWDSFGDGDSWKRIYRTNSTRPSVLLKSKDRPIGM